MRIRKKLIIRTIEELARQECTPLLFEGTYYSDSDGESKNWINGRLRAEMFSKTNNKLVLGIELYSISSVWQFVKFCEEKRPLDYASTTRLPLEMSGMSQ